MKIAILSAFYPLRGGIAQFSACLYRALEQDHEVKAFTFTRQYPNFLFPGETQYVQEGDKADAIPSEEVLDSINPFSYRKCAKAIHAFEPDVLIINHWMSFFGPAFGSVASQMGSNTKVISVLHNVVPHEKRFFDKPFTKYFLKHNDAFVVLSEAVKNELLSFRPKEERILLSPHPYYDHFGEAIDKREARQTLGLHPDKKTLLFFGFIRAYKGLDLLLEAFDLLDDSYQLLIAGESYGSFEAYQKQIDGSANKARIHLIDRYISDDEVPGIFSASDVCMLPYKSATQSGIANIAMHFELPMIASDVGGLKESIEHGRTGLIIDKLDADQWYRSIQHFFDKVDRTAFSDAIAQQKASNTWELFSSRIVELVRGLE